MLCRSSAISSTLPHTRLAGVFSLTFSAVAIQSLKNKDIGWGVMGTAQLISSAYFVKKCTCPVIWHPTFSLHITHFDLELLSILISNFTSQALTDSFKTSVQLAINKHT